MTLHRPETYERLLVRAPFEFRRERVALPSPAATAYIVRVDVCGLCRSDLHAAATWATDWQEVGHEFGGTIVAAPNAGGRFAIGDRVAVRNASPCGECDACLSGRGRRCERLVVNMQGFRDYALCDERSLVPAADLDDDLLALVEPTNVVLDLLHTASPEPSQRVTVLGSGTLGLLTAFFAQRTWRIDDVAVVGRAPASPLAEALGIPGYRSLDDRIRHADRVLVTTPPSTLDRAMALCRPGGTVLTVGLDDTERCQITFNASRLIFGQLTVRGICAAPNAHFHEAVSLLREHGATLRKLIARRTPRAQLEIALQAWRDRAYFEGKTIVVNRADVP